MEMDLWEILVPFVLLALAFFGVTSKRDTP